MATKKKPLKQALYKFVSTLAHSAHQRSYGEAAASQMHSFRRFEFVIGCTEKSCEGPESCLVAPTSIDRWAVE